LSGILARWNRLPLDAAAHEILACCGSREWARRLAAARPIKDEASLIAASDRIWNNLGPQDWIEAFSQHPRIGEQRVPQAASAQSAKWSAQEQQHVASAAGDIQHAMALANQEYERRFGRVFLVCATGKSAAELLEVLRRRLRNDPAAELHVAAEEQRKITNLRLGKWLQE